MSLQEYRGHVEALLGRSVHITAPENRWFVTFVAVGVERDRPCLEVTPYAPSGPLLAAS